MENKQLKENERMKRMVEENPMGVIALIVSGVVYYFFTPWYVRLWRKLKRII